MPAPTEYQQITGSVNATIANGQTTSGVANIGGATLVGLNMPAAFTGASVTFQGATSASGTFQTLMKDGSDLSVTVTQGKWAILNPADFAGVSFLKVVSASSEAAQRVIELITRPV